MRAEGAATRRAAERKGRFAEALCAAWLRLKGYRVVARRMRTPMGEIDIVARRGGVLAIVEVKARGGAGEAAESLGPHQRRRLDRAARWLVAGRPHWHGLSVRFDVMLVAGWRLAHIADAFRAEEP